MDMSTKDMLMKKLLESQENVRDYSVYSQKIDNEEISNTLREFGQEIGVHARRLRELIEKHDLH